MKPNELKTLMENLRKHFVFHAEALEIIMAGKNYSKTSARTKLYEYCRDGLVKKHEVQGIPTLYNKSDLLTVVSK